MWSRGELAAVAELADEHDAGSSRTRSTGRSPTTYTPFLSVADRAVTITSASKALNLAGLKWV